MKLIVGLGNNPCEKYHNTRHNTGFWAVDTLKDDLKAGASPATTVGEAVFFKNSGFINNSGVEVKETINRFGVSLEDLLVIHDDFDLELGQFKLQFGRSSAGHKGVQSVIDQLGSKNFWRLRIGVGLLPVGVEANDYVLDRFSPQEREILDSIYPQILATVKDWVLKK
jgi:PTH1 family peptidyl-tRNA hydrolase